MQTLVGSTGSLFELLFATHNGNKVQEAQAILGDRYAIRDANSLGLTDAIPEDFDTLEDNSYQKASYLYHFVLRRFGERGVCISDDTGLEVEALGGAPGVYSARYAGPGCDFADNIALLLRNMEGLSHRSARFRTVVTLIGRDGESVQFEGVVHGSILESRSGVEGFGYDPIFRPSGYSASFAEMSCEQKNQLSHRGRAFRALREYLDGLPGGI